MTPGIEEARYVREIGAGVGLSAGGHEPFPEQGKRVPQSRSGREARSGMHERIAVLVPVRVDDARSVSGEIAGRER